MAFVDDREDINSVCMTAVSEGFACGDRAAPRALRAAPLATRPLLLLLLLLRAAGRLPAPPQVQRLLDRYGVDPRSIGRVEVGTESLVDKSKSTKTTLMRLLGGNADVEGATVINACYGGTAALFNSTAWVESSEWDGRYALVVCGDVAVYEAGPARPTGGVGAVAMLVGRDAPLRLRPRSRATHAVDVYDFYKPRMLSEYPAVDGKLSQACYLAAVDDCYGRHMDKAQPRGATLASAYDHALFHSPYHKLVQQSFRRLVFNDARRAARGGAPLPPALAALAPFVGLPDAATYANKDLDKALAAASDAAFAAAVEPSTAFSRAIGNSYTGALWTNLACLVDAVGPALAGRRLAMFSYGSGALATMFAVDAAPRADDAVAPFSLAGMQHAMDIKPRLAARRAADNDEFTHALKLREAAYGQTGQPKGDVAHVPAGAWFLADVKPNHVREYARKEE